MLMNRFLLVSTRCIISASPMSSLIKWKEASVLLNLLENRFDQKRIFANPNPSSNLNSITLTLILNVTPILTLTVTLTQTLKHNNVFELMK